MGWTGTGMRPQAGAGIPGTLEDIVSALDAVADLRREVDVSRVVVFGHSSGGQLALTSM